MNRAKTKRWVEAKQYSYDGGDWGDEDDDEEEEQPAPAAAPRPPYANQRTGSSSEVSLRRLSGFMGAESEGRGSPLIDNTGADQQKALPFVRPSELYRRMGSNDSNNEATVASPIQQVQEDLPRDDSGSTLSAGTQVAPAPAPASVPAIGLPDIQRMSAFGTDFLGGDSTAAPTSSETSGSLQHNPSQASQASQASQGFTSVVHQAFDVPETPNSTTGSVARSNSDGTSVISPIISNRGPNDDKTPTIPEEPNESSTPVDAATSGPVLIPGHRRDLSLPDRDNSPSKKPAVTEHTPPPGGQAELSSISPGETPLPEQSPQEISPSKDFVAPLKLGDRKQSESSGGDGYRGSIPTIVQDPAMNDSPQDADSDRLREEIMRSLSREGSQEPEQAPEIQAGQPKEESIPNQYEKYWDGQTGPSPAEAVQPLVSESHPDWINDHPLSPHDPYAPQPAPIAAPVVADPAPQKPRLGRRFSWESSGSAEAPAVPAAQTAPADETSMAVPDAVQDYEPADRAPEKIGGEIPNYDSEGSGSQRVEKPRLSIVPPIPESNSPPVQVMGPSDSSEKQTTVGTSYVDENKLQGFRDILKLSTPVARVKAFDSTRDQFAVLDTGLNNWLRLTLDAHPEHADVLNVNQSQPTRNSPTRTRFPKLPTLGALGTPKEDGTPTSANHLRRPSGNIGTIMNKSAVEQRGKEFLHTAGTFGGKAGGAAKGLFAKGRSKFRATGDKVDT